MNDHGSRPDGETNDTGDSDEPANPVGRGPETGAALCAPFLASLPIDGASVSVLGTGTRQTTIAASDALALRLEELQFDLAEGPHWQAIAENRTVLVSDLDGPDGDEWPVFASAAVNAGVRALFAFPLRLGAVVIGTVDLYRAAPGPLDGTSLESAGLLARAATASATRLAMLSARGDATRDAPGTPALRREVHQAVGMIIVQLDVSATDAFARLRAHAFAADRPVRDVASDVVRGRIDFASLAEDGTDT